MTKITAKTISMKIKLPGVTVTIGPGSVPTSKSSVRKTIVKEMVSELRKVSKDGIFDTDKEHYDSNLSSTSK